MPNLRSLLRQPSIRLYLLGHALVLIGAWLMELTQSVLPLALAASAALMLMVPLLRLLGTRFAAARRRDSRRR